MIEVSGVLNKRTTDSSLEKINDAVLTQSIFGRIFGFGDLDILTASESGISRFRMLVQPVRFKRAMLDAKHEYERDIEGAAMPRARRSEASRWWSASPVRRTRCRRPCRRHSLRRLWPRAALRDEVTRTLNSFRPARSRGHQRRRVRTQEGRPARASLTLTDRAATIRGTH